VNKTKRAMTFVILAASMWGTVGVSVKVLSGFGLTAIQMVVARLVVAAVLIGIFLLITDKSKLKISKKDIKYFIGTGICSMLFFNTCYCVTVQLTSLSIAAVLLYTSPIFVTIFSVPIFKEKLTVKKVMAMIGSVLGCALVSGVLSTGMAGVSLKGLIFGIFAAIGYGFYGIQARMLVKKYHSYTILFYTFLIAGLGGICIGDVGGILHIVKNEPVSLGIIVITAIICNVMPYIFYTTALKYIEASKASVTASVEPVVATVLGVILYKESITVSGILGILCVLLAIGVLNQDKCIEERQ